MHKHDAVIGAVLTTAPGREENLRAVLTCLEAQTKGPEYVVVVCDGCEPSPEMREKFDYVFWLITPPHTPGNEQPRNLGTRSLVARVADSNRARRRHQLPDLPVPTHVWFLDSDVIIEPGCMEALLDALDEGPANRIIVAPYYELLAQGDRPEPGVELSPRYHAMRSDFRWPSFDQHPPSEVRRNDLAAGLACLSGNLLWPIEEFQRVGGFWSELYHGRCEDGELGLRAVAMDVGISFTPRARGWHLWHPRNDARTARQNQREVPMINQRHPWVRGSDVFVVDRDGKAFDVRCRGCQEVIPTSHWWWHAESCGVPPGIPVPWLRR